MPRTTQLLKLLSHIPEILKKGKLAQCVPRGWTEARFKKLTLKHCNNAKDYRLCSQSLGIFFDVWVVMCMYFLQFGKHTATIILKCRYQFQVYLQTIWSLKKLHNLRSLPL